MLPVAREIVLQQFGDRAMTLNYMDGAWVPDLTLVNHHHHHVQYKTTAPYTQG